MEEKLSYSFSLTISAKLSFSEDKINEIVDIINTQSDFQIGKILLNYRRRQHFRDLGKLYLVRANTFFNVNLLIQRYKADIPDDYVAQFKAMNIYNNVKNSLLIRK